MLDARHGIHTSSAVSVSSDGTDWPTVTPVRSHALWFRPGSNSGNRRVGNGRGAAGPTGMVPPTVECSPNHTQPGSSDPSHEWEVGTRPSPGAGEETAAYTARGAPHAGFLEKMGSRVATMKRRFFVLQPGTHLYYFLSPHDVTPRGCLDLQDSWVEPVPGPEPDRTWPDGRFRFAICWPSRERVVLEARSLEAGQAWMRFLKEERLDVVKAAVEQGTRRNSALTSRVQELTRQVQDLKLVEKDRDGALEDAAHWKQEFERLDESLRRLTQYLVKPNPDYKTHSGIPETTLPDKATVSSKDTQKEDVAASQGETDTQASTDEDSDPVTPKGNEMTDNTARETSLLDDVVEREEALDVVHVPGMYFSSLYNTCEQLRENLKLASDEASTAVDDLHAANLRVASVEKRMSKAEKHLCKLWEENCTIRKALKQKKREKRVLVREVKNLLEAAKTQKVDELSMHEGVPPDDESTALGSEEEKLMDELEGHVLSSIRLHEQLLAVSGPTLTARVAVQSQSQIPKSIGIKPISNEVAKANQGPTVRFQPQTQRKVCTNQRANDDPMESESGQALVSLFDESEEAPSSEDGCGHSLSSIGAEASDAGADGDLPLPKLVDVSMDSVEMPERPNPLVELDKEEDLSLELANATSPFAVPRPMIRQGDATSKLVCPLADVIDSKGDTLNLEATDLQIYHLTFYSQKIGIQFQKVPPMPTKPKGLLTDALTADLNGVPPSGSEETAAELRRIAGISSWASSSTAASKDTDRGQGVDTCLVAAPIDAVLVCGFHGFDDSGNNVRPKLGAHLVAFDGVSVEVGHWTFDSIRKAIQARARPLTLSFRNDFLTTEQRRILTKAIGDVASPPMQKKSIDSQYKTPRERPPSTDPSVHSAVSQGSNRYVLDENTDTELGSGGLLSRFNHPVDADDDLSVASARSRGDSSQQNHGFRHGYHPASFSGNRSVASSTLTTGPRSFSDVGSTTSGMSAVVAPLVAHLLSRPRETPFTPDYLRRAPQNVEETPQHQDFASELL